MPQTSIHREAWRRIRIMESPIGADVVMEDTDQVISLRCSLYTDGFKDNVKVFKVSALFCLYIILSTGCNTIL